LALAVCACAGVRAAPPPIATDRPDKTEGTSLIAPGWTQLEAGLTSYSPRFGQRSVEYGEALFRHGLARRLEARFEIPSIIKTEATDAEYGDGGIGIKTPLFVPTGKTPPVIPELSLLVSTGVSTHWGDGPAFGTPEVNLAAAWPVSDRLELASNFVVQPFAKRSDDVWVGATLALGVGLTERLGSYFEIYDLGIRTLNGGVTYRVHDHLQVDARAGVAGWGYNSPRIRFVGVGFGTRW
jgi:hypothetical protein